MEKSENDKNSFHRHFIHKTSGGSRLDNNKTEQKNMKTTNKKMKNNIYSVFSPTRYKTNKIMRKINKT